MDTHRNELFRLIFNIILRHKRGFCKINIWVKLGIASPPPQKTIKCTLQVYTLKVGKISFLYITH